jgi:hypothetical protein
MNVYSPASRKLVVAGRLHIVWSDFGQLRGVVAEFVTEPARGTLAIVADGLSATVASLAFLVDTERPAGEVRIGPIGRRRWRAVVGAGVAARGQGEYQCREP